MKTKERLEVEKAPRILGAKTNNNDLIYKEIIRKEEPLNENELIYTVTVDVRILVNGEPVHLSVPVDGFLR